MRRWTFLAAVLAAQAAVAAEPPAELMQRLADWARRTDPQNALASVKIHTLTEELDGDGKVLHTDEVVVRVLHQGEDEFPRTELISATRDGKDQRAEAEKKQAEAREKAAKAKAEGKKPQRGSLSGAMPFHADQQSRYAFTLLEPYADDPERLRIGFKPKGENQAEIFVGEAKVDPVRGAVLWMKQQPSTMPMMVDSMDMSLHFGGASEGGPLLSALRLRGKAGLPFMKKRFRVAMRLSDFQLKPAQP